MKHLLPIIALFTVACSSSKKTEVYDPRAPHYGDTKITVDRTIPLDSLELILFERGFTVDTKNVNIGTITTQPRKLRNAEGAVKVRAISSNGRTILTGEFAINYDINGGIVTLKRTFEQVKYQGMKKSIAMYSWEAIDNVAKKIGGEITYSK